MAIFEHQNGQMDAERAAIAARLCDFADTLPERPEVAAARLQGEQICSILEPLGLPEALVAAVRVYPLHREGLIGSKDLQKLKIDGLPELVQGLVQLGRFSLPPEWRPGEALAVQQSEALRKMLLAVVSDARLVVVRIAEQLYRLRLAKSADTAEQRALAIETQEIYAPLANRLGVWQFKWELEDLAFRYLEQESYQQIAKTLKEKRNERESFIEDLKATLGDELARNDITADISGRPKHIFSIWKKMQRKDRGLDHIFDIRAIRVLVSDVTECYAALGIVHNLWSYLPGEFDDYIANPKDNNYQSLHTAVIGPGGQTVEVQIRTHDMHRHAELGVAAHWRYKEGSTSRESFDQKIHFLRQLLEPSESDHDLLDQIRGDIFEDRVYDAGKLNTARLRLPRAYPGWASLPRRQSQWTHRAVDLHRPERRQDRDHNGQRPATESRLAKSATWLPCRIAKPRQGSQLVSSNRQGPEQTSGSRNSRTRTRPPECSRPCDRSNCQTVEVRQ
jgi:GTP pyrophosphokinase